MPESKGDLDHVRHRGVPYALFLDVKPMLRRQYWVLRITGQNAVQGLVPKC